MLWRGVFIKILMLFAIFLLGGCASVVFEQDLPRQAFLPSGSDEFARHMPVVVSERPRHSYNRIGYPEIVNQDGQLQLRINPGAAVVYTEKRSFETARGKYTNLIYRLHFEKVPFSLLPFNLTMGRNVGVLLIVTLNSDQQPILISTVHTCGCYLAMQPTSYLPKTAYPDNWNTEQQSVYGALLPGLIKFDQSNDDKLMIYLQDETHRVNHMEVMSLQEVMTQYATQALTLRPMSDLDQLPHSGQPVSMFKSAGAERGYVRDVSKPFELMLVSWWALDWHVGVDKRYGKAGDPGPRFYTSIKPWARQASDMRDFPRFLDYWGWRL